MLEKILRDWSFYSTGYSWRSEIDAMCKKNMHAYTGAIISDKYIKTYLPQYSAREHENDYADRQARAKNGYMNFPEKIISIYQNSLFRSGEPNRDIKSDEIKRFVKNVDGGSTSIGEFVKDIIFIYNQVHGGCFIVVDKPKAPEMNSTLTKKQQNDLNFYPYAYTYTWEDCVNFDVDRYRQLEWIIFKEAAVKETIEQIVLEYQYRYFDKNNWALIDKEGKKIDGNTHGLGMVPVVRSFNRRNAAHKFLTPKSAIDDVVRLSLKIFEYQSQLEQMIVMHTFLKLAMPQSMWDNLKESGMGTVNAFVFPDGAADRAYYIETPQSEIQTMVDLVYTEMPDKILYFATLRDKVSMPREESGVAKFIDSGDEMTNLLEKANNMEKAENDMIKLAAMWESKSIEENTVSYNKIFDIKSTNEQIQELVDIFKEDLGSPVFNKEMVKRLMFNMLGHVSEDMKKDIEADLEWAIDPSLSLEDIDRLTDFGAMQTVKIIKKYNPELRGKSDEEIAKIIADNLKMRRAAAPLPQFQQTEEE